MRHKFLSLLMLFLIVPRVVGAQAPAADTPEPGSAEEIARATTEPRFLSPWVASLPLSAGVVSPRTFLHRIPGAPGELVDSATAFAYCRALAASSPRVRLFTIGRSEEGRDIVMLAIADEQGIADLERLRAATAALSDARKTDEQAAASIVATARPIYYLNAGLHSDETGSTESVLELAYRLAVSEQPMIQRIRSSVVVLINPVANPDGRDKQVQWFYRYLKGRTEQGTLPRQAPPYWSKYAFVDINRDAHQQVHETTKAVFRMLFAWHPQVIHDLHESIALLLTWNGTNPINEHVDPLTYAERLELSFHEVQTLTGFGMPGVWTWNFGDDWAHLYLDSIATNHNADGRGYETFGNGSAETMRSQQPGAGRDGTVEWYRPLPSPPTNSFLWSARDNVNYNETALLAALDDTAAQAKTLLHNYYTKSAHSYRRGLEQAPYGFVIPAGQGDPTRVAQLVERLLSLGIEVQRATAAFTLKEGSYPAGTYVVRLDQPYRDYAVDLLSLQEYPKDGPEAYDDVSWSFPAHYHLTVTASADPQVRSVSAEQLQAAPHVSGAVNGSGPAFVLKDTGQEGLLEARWVLARFHVAIAEHAFSVAGVDYPAGSWILSGQPGLAAALRSAATQLGLDFVSLAAVPDVARHEAPLPRLGLWVPWADTDTSGWARYTLDQRHIPYTYVRDEDIRAGRLKDKYDVLVYPHVDLELAEQIEGLHKSWGPMPFRKTAATPAFGTPAASDDITGGIGYAGLAELQKYIEAGGLLITLGNGTMLPLESGLVRGVRREAGGAPRSSQGGGTASAAAAANAETRTPGSHVRVSFARPDHPIAYGYAPRTWVFRQNFALYSIPRRWLRMAYCTVCLDGPVDRSGIVLEWGDREGAPFVVSGQAWGEDNLIGRAAIMDMPVGKGHVITFNFNPLHRDLNRGDERLLWNAILNWRAIVTAH
jgi:Zinc carboxypeptidase